MKIRNLIILFFISIIFLCPVFSQNKIIRVGYLRNSTGFMQGKNSTEPKSGYGYDYLIQISNYTDWKYEYVYGDWPVLYRMFLNGELDILPEVTFTEGRKDKMLFPEYSMGNENFYLYITEENHEISTFNEKSINNKKIGVVKNTVCKDVLELWLNEKSLVSEIIIYDSSEELTEALKTGKIDSAVEADLNDTADFIPVFKIGSSDFYLAVSNNRPDLLAELNKTLEEIYKFNPYFNEKLHDKYFSRIGSLKSLNDDEEEYFKNNSIIRIGVLNNYLPFSAMDVSSGNITGLVSDLIKRIFETFDLQDKVKAEYVFYDSVYDGFLALDDHKIDMFFPANGSKWDAENYNYYETEPVTYSAEKIIYKGIYDENNILHMGVIKGSPEYYYATNVFPRSTLLLYDSYTELLDAVVNGEIRAALVNIYQDQLIFSGNESYKNLKSLELPLNCGYSFIVGKNNKQLFHFISRGLNMLDQDFINSSVVFYAARTMQYTLIDFVNDYLNYICFFFIVFVAMIILLIYTLDKLHNYADFDALTHIRTEKGLKIALRDSINHAVETEEYFCIAIAEVNNFQNYISTYGNRCGDEILKYISSCFVRGINKDDIAFRYKDNRILVILNCKANMAESIIQKIKDEIDSESFSYKENEIHIKLGVGISAYADGATPKIMLEEAEMKLFN